ncbi:hypothetical protein T484DRAFT_2794824 [Baffinella frigidus]|nr:hypothetical protein T484DRAFT_2794824 [Cryptophyta sp. CCMP2293]
MRASFLHGCPQQGAHDDRILQRPSLCSVPRSTHRNSAAPTRFRSGWSLRSSQTCARREPAHGRGGERQVALRWGCEGQVVRHTWSRTHRGVSKSGDPTCLTRPLGYIPSVAALLTSGKYLSCGLLFAPWSATRTGPAPLRLSIRTAEVVRSTSSLRFAIACCTISTFLRLEQESNLKISKTRAREEPWLVARTPWQP